jgi:hemerythrin-like domain-containing protein
MTTTVPTPVPATRPAPAEPDLSGFTLMHRALRSGTRMLAEAVDGVARDDVCDRARQRGIVSFAVAVLTEVRAHLEREDAALYRLVVVSADEWAGLAPLSADHAELERLLHQAWSALPVFARCASSGAPLLALVLTELAERLAAHLAAEEEIVFPRIRAHVTCTELARCRTRLRAGTSTARLLFLAPWLADQCHPAELRHVLAGADPRGRLLLSLGQKRYTARRDAVLG